MVKRLKKYTNKVTHTLKQEGVVSVGIKSLQKIQKYQQSKTSTETKKQNFVSLVDRGNVMAADWSNVHSQTYKKRKKPYTVCWIMSPPAGGGGHQNIFRFIDYLDSKGFKNKVYLYSNFDDTTPQEAAENVKSYSSAKNTTFERFEGDIAEGADVLFATGWETAYPVFNINTEALKFYFVQDFEPLFYPMGTDYILAENTYKFGLHGITAGGWLAEKLQSEYDMKTNHYDFGANKNNYKITNTKARKEVFFYARPVTERRGFDLGIMALELFHEEMPDYTINLAGWDVSGWNVPFPYVNHKAMAISDLNGLYNKCSAALVMSLTNMSLLPLELLSSGVVPVVNEGPNNRLVSDNPNIEYTAPSPRALADAMIRSVERNNLSQVSSELHDSVSSTGWDDAGDIVISILEKELERAK